MKWVGKSVKHCTAKKNQNIQSFLYILIPSNGQTTQGFSDKRGTIWNARLPQES
jgi:hypothetical protein